MDAKHAESLQAKKVSGGYGKPQNGSEPIYMDTLGVAIRELKAKVKEYARPESAGWNDNRRISAINIDLVRSIWATRISMKRTTDMLEGDIDRVLVKVVYEYIDQIESYWN